MFAIGKWDIFWANILFWGIVATYKIPIGLLYNYPLPYSHGISGHWLCCFVAQAWKRDHMTTWLGGFYFPRQVLRIGSKRLHLRRNYLISFASGLLEPVEVSHKGMGKITCIYFSFLLQAQKHFLHYSLLFFKLLYVCKCSKNRNLQKVSISLAKDNWDSFTHLDGV